MRKLIAVIAIGVLMVVGTAVASAHWGGWDEEAVTDKLDQLVEEGTLTQEQADSASSLFSVLRSLAADRRAEKEALREQWEGFWEDELLTAEEIEQLPENHPFRDTEGEYADYLADGQITAEELDEIKSERGHYGRKGRWGGHRSGFWGKGFWGNSDRATEEDPAANTSYTYRTNQYWRYTA